ncbi:MAG: PstS family phosphate ABC transporter substrate-binding protein [Coriobacteriia bacterium]|nr:PstS family phosphate ABC transporter substrate-binding protein [Coriobacteriia bacterium]
MKIIKWLVVAVSVMVLALALVGCGGTETEDSIDTTTSDDASDASTSDLSGMISIEGSDTMVNLAQAWAEEFMNEHPGVMITIKGGGSGAGIASLINGTTDFANASRNVKDEEFEAGHENNIDITENEVARDGIAIMVNGANPVEELTTEQLGEIYRGEITDWSEVGGNDGAIVLLGRDTSSGTYEFFQEHVIGKELEYSKEMRNLQSNQAIVDELKNNANAIGYVGVGYEVPELTVVKIDGVASSVSTIKDGSYSLSRMLYMDSDGVPSGLQKAFLDWVKSPIGQSIVEDEGFVPL